MRELSPVCEEVESGFGFLEQVRRQKVRSLARIIAGRIRPSELLPYMHGIEKGMVELSNVAVFIQNQDYGNKRKHNNINFLGLN